MSYSQPPPSPGPYGGGHPNPYAQGGAAGQPGYGSPQPGPAPAQPGYGFPQQQPGPYGQPGPQTPYTRLPMPSHGGSRRAKAIGLAVAGVVVVTAIVGGLLLLGSSGDGGPYKLTTPETVAEVFHRQGQGLDGSGLNAEDRKSLEQIPGITHPQPVQAAYAGTAKSRLFFTGVSGEVTNPEQVVDAMFGVVAQAAVEGADIKPVGGPEPVTPEGFDGGVMKCQKYKLTFEPGSGAPVDSAEVPMCIWGDSSTVGAVLVLDPLTLASGTADVSGTAQTTAKVRTDARVDITK